MTADSAYDSGIDQLAHGNTAAAIADLVTAHDLAPRDTEIAAALASAREQAGSLVHAAEPWPVSSTELGGALVVVNLALAIVIALRQRRVVTMALIAAVALFAAVWLARLAATPTYVIVAKADTTTHVVSDATSLTRFAVRLGDELPVESGRGDWLKVRGPDGTRAYIQRDDVVSVELERQHELGSVER